MLKPYDHFCALAQALDVVGDRWTPLVLRELMFGARRFSDLLGGLPGISATLLSRRLRHLEEHAILARRTLPAPAASAVYELTRDGRELAESLVPLARWGIRRMGARRRGQALRARWMLLYLHAVFRPEEARGLDTTFEVRVAEEVFRVHVRDGTLHTEQVLAPGVPDLAIEGDLETVVDVGVGRVAVEEAVARGRLRLVGDAASAQRFRRLFPHGPPDAARAS
jgi:DNA-binding HxlR family transcriptional regulator